MANPNNLPIVQDVNDEGSSYELSNMSDRMFERGLERMATRQKRIVKLMQALKEGVHWGNPKDRHGNDVFDKPILFVEGADELRLVFRMHLCEIVGKPDLIVQSEEFVSVIVYRGIVDMTGQVVATGTASCNTKEKRFKKYAGDGWIYTDAREKLHECLVMAENRVAKALTVEALGLGPFFARGGAPEDEVIDPLSDDERRGVMKLAAARGMTRKELIDLIVSLFGRPKAAKSELETLTAAIEAWVKPQQEKGK